MPRDARPSQLSMPFPEGNREALVVQQAVLDRDFREHDHRFHELVVLVGGTAEHVIDREAYPVCSGDVYVFHPGVAHGFRRVKRLRLYNVMWQGTILARHREALERVAGYHALFTIEPGMRPFHRFAARLHLDPVPLSRIVARLEDMREECEARREGWGAALEGGFLQLAVQLSRLYTATRGPAARDVLRLARAVAHLEENFLGDLRIPDLTRLSGVSPRQFLRLFHQVYGTAPAEYLLARRIRHATELLRRSGCSVTEAALASGFNDSNYFSRAFRKATGQTPSAWKKAAGKVG